MRARETELVNEHSDVFGHMIQMVIHSIRLRLRYHERQVHERARLKSMELKRLSSLKQQKLGLIEREKLL